MSDELHPSKPDYWRKRWTEGRTGWDQGGIHPLFPELLETARRSGLKDGAQIIEPGCGRAHTAAMLARTGYKVTAFDVSELAISSARELYGKVAGLHLVVADLFQPPAEWEGHFDAVYDRAVLCALPKDVRAGHVATCARILKPGGLFMSLPFTRLHIAESDGPPFAVSEEQFTALMQRDFDKISHRQVDHEEPDSKIATEMIAVWRRK